MSPQEIDESKRKSEETSRNEEKQKENSQSDDSQGEDEYVVERVLRHRRKNGHLQFFLKWKGYPDSENTWEDEENVFAQNLVEEYWEGIGGRPNTKTASKSKTNGDNSSKSAPTRSDFKRKRAIDLSDEGIDTDDDFPPSYWGSWEEEVENIETVEKTNEGLFVYLHWKNGQRTVHDSREVNEKCPQKVISFYEKHLRFRIVE
ncbi:943_t:CDS:2 [Paraglomus occultum]|uniref:943_t:CDS:1 n=1 Tax=Paraglomus occultum TaxID=144539 RepID=A0A9N9ABI3_9GLOM|nr:943_t:CDS:2 [Paraglomus occultum]